MWDPASQPLILSQVRRDSQSRGQGFDPPMLHQKRKSSTKVLLFLLYEKQGGRTRKGRKVRWTFLVRARLGRAQDGRPERAANPPMLHQKRKGSTKVLLFLFSKDRGVEPERAEELGPGL